LVTDLTKERIAQKFLQISKGLIAQASFSLIYKTDSTANYEFAKRFV